MPKCSSCKNGEIDRSAEVLVLILDNPAEDKPRPHKQWLCSDHLEAITTDGATYRTLKTVEPVD